MLWWLGETLAAAVPVCFSMRLFKLGLNLFTTLNPVTL